MAVLDDPLADRIKRGIAAFTEIAERVGELERAEGSPKRVKELEAEEERLRGKLEREQQEREGLERTLLEMPDVTGLFQDLEDARRGILDIEEVYDKWLSKIPA